LRVPEPGETGGASPLLTWTWIGGDPPWTLLPRPDGAGGSRRRA
jgi:hypothetical protein